MSTENELTEDETRDALDERIQERIGQRTLVDKMQEKKKVATKDKNVFMADFENHWYIYAFLAVSALFTMTLGIYMGLSPTKTSTGLYFNTDFMHLFLAMVYAIAFVTITEGAFVLGKFLFQMQEGENGIQKTTSVIVMGFAGISILVTGVAGGMVIASNISFLTDFVEIPEFAQRWVIIVIPAMLFLYTALLALYQLSSHEAKSERTLRQKEKDMMLDHRARSRAIELINLEDLQVEEMKHTLALVKSRRVQIGRALANTRVDNMLGGNQAPAIATDTERAELPNA